ncbi:hypothetical protein AB205_0088820, partial [Aquarana catesbeiana]
SIELNITMASQLALTSTDGSRNRNPPERCPRPLYSRDSTQEDQEDQVEGLILIKVEEEPCVRGDDWCKEEEDPPEISTDTRDTQIEVKSEEEEEGHVEIKEEEIPPEISTDGSSDRNIPERCPRPLYSRDSTQEHQEIPQEDQDTDLTTVKVEVKEEAEEVYARGNELCKEDSIPLEISTDPGDIRETQRDIKAEDEGHVRIKLEVPQKISTDAQSIRRKSFDVGIKNNDITSDSSEDDSITLNISSQIPIADLSNVSPTHGGEKPFSCSICGRCFIRRQEVIIHERTHKGQKPFSCPDCGKCFTTKKYLVKHQRTHTDQKPYSCDECGKRFAEASKFLKHEKTHRIKRAFLCSHCGRSFPDKARLDQHEITHTGEKPYSCLECGKSFSYRAFLVRHQRRHSGEKPYSCLKCGKRVTTKYSLIKHQRTHTNQKPYSCSECGKFFSQVSKVIKHEKTHRGGECDFLQSGKC